MTNQITLITIVRLCSELYTQDGVAIWLGNKNKLLDNQIPIQLCQTPEGRDKVYALLSALADGVFA